jgi:tRNA threonylcarbamoyladenosine biosynthesis protein TsaE
VSSLIVSESPGRTAALGEALGKVLLPGDVVLLRGDLGSGKTCFAQGIAAGLEVAAPVKSSSFILLAEYQGRHRLYHADFYRLSDPQEAVELSLDEYAADGVLVVEWPDRAPSALPPTDLDVLFTLTGPTSRRLEVNSESARGNQLEAALEELQPSS